MVDWEATDAAWRRLKPGYRSNPRETKTTVFRPSRSAYSSQTFLIPSTRSRTRARSAWTNRPMFCHASAMKRGSGKDDDM